MSARHRIVSPVEHSKLGSFLKSLRVGLHVSQRDLAAKLNLPQSFVSKVESGERQLQLLEFLIICGKLEVSAPSAVEAFQKGE